jgi:hypothetical protein
LIFGPDQNVVIGPRRPNALDFLLDQLAPAGVTPNPNKFRVLGSSRSAAMLKPSTMEEPFIEFIKPDGSVGKSHGIHICSVAIGEELYVADYLRTTTTSICTRIVETATLLSQRDAHAASAVFNYSLNSRADYMMMTHLPSETAAVGRDIDDALRQAHSVIASFDILDPAGLIANQPDPSFTRDRFCTSIKYGGGGFRPQEQRLQFLSCINGIMPRMIRRTDGLGSHTPGLWESLTDVIGPGSFDPGKEDSRWEALYASNSAFGRDIKLEWQRLQARQAALIAQLPQASVPQTPTLLSVDAARFGAGVQQLQKEISAVLSSLQSKLLLHRACQLPRDDQRRMAFLACLKQPTTRALLEGLPNPSVLLSSVEFREALASMFGSPSPVCANIVGRHIRNSAGCRQLRVDLYGNNLKKVQGATGDHIRDMHDTIVAYMVESLISAGVVTIGGYHRTCRDLFAHLISGNVSDGDSAECKRHLQGIIPDIVTKLHAIIFAFGNLAGNPLINKHSLLDVKTLAPGTAYSEHDNGVAATGPVNRRQKQVDADYHKSAQALDRKFNGTPQNTVGPVESELNRYGRVMGLVVGAFSECSTDVYHLRDLVAYGYATALTAKLKIPFDQAVALYSTKVNRLWGLVIARGWSRVLLGRLALTSGEGHSNGAARAASAMGGLRTRDGDAHECGPRGRSYHDHRHPLHGRRQ